MLITSIKGFNITNPKRVTIGKRDKQDPLMMLSNENYLKYFPDGDLPDVNERAKRSSCLRTGTWIIIRKKSIFLMIPRTKTARQVI